MKRKISTQFLKYYQQKTSTSSFISPIQQYSSQFLHSILVDVKRPFQRICIHSRYPHHLINHVINHNKKYKSTTSITCTSNYRSQILEELLQKKIIQQIRYFQGQTWIPQQNQYDLLLSSFQTHKFNNQQSLFDKYLRCLKPDGALIGSSLTEGTLNQLYASYLLAESQRHGGMSPKVLELSGAGQIGSMMTLSKYKLITLMTHEQKLQFQSIVDLISVLQDIGETGYLRGRRKGVYKDLLLAASALYHSSYQQNQRILASLSLCYYIGWKYHSNQPKQLNPGPVVGSVEFSSELSKFGEVQNYILDEQKEEAEKVK